MSPLNYLKAPAGFNPTSVLNHTDNRLLCIDSVNNCYRWNRHTDINTHKAHIVELRAGGCVVNKNRKDLYVQLNIDPTTTPKVMKPRYNNNVPPPDHKIIVPPNNGLPAVEINNLISVDELPRIKQPKQPKQPKAVKFEPQPDTVHNDDDEKKKTKPKHWNLFDLLS